MDDYAVMNIVNKPTELQQKMKLAGFRIVKTTSFVSLLVPLMLLSRSQKRGKEAEFDPVSELALLKVLNTVLFVVMKLELAFIKLGVNFPMGGSRLVLATKTRKFE